ncbi:MAG: hypothetical protein H8D45_13555 [Bacteroidetes bacterium]|nr:hypothetical protein [Bacteroidota bacterium]
MTIRAFLPNTIGYVIVKDDEFLYHFANGNFIRQLEWNEIYLQNVIGLHRWIEVNIDIDTLQEAIEYKGGE